MSSPFCCRLYSCQHSTAVELVPVSSFCQPSCRARGHSWRSSSPGVWSWLLGPCHLLQSVSSAPVLRVVSSDFSRGFSENPVLFCFGLVFSSPLEPNPYISFPRLNSWCGLCYPVLPWLIQSQRVFQGAYWDYQKQRWLRGKGRGPPIMPWLSLGLVSSFSQISIWVDKPQLDSSISVVTKRGWGVLNYIG